MVRMPELIVLQVFTQSTSFSREMLTRATDSALASMSTSGLALFSGVAYAIFKLFLSFSRDGWTGMKDHFAKDVFHGLIFGVFWWILLFSYHLSWKVPNEIRQEAASVVVPQLDRTLRVPSQAYQHLVRPQFSKEIPTVEISFTAGGLPIRIQPSTCLTILVLNRKLQRFPDEICNSDPQTMFYPAVQMPSDGLWRSVFIADGGRVNGKGAHLAARKKSGWYEEGYCEIKNHSDRELVNARVTFKVSYMSSKKVEAFYSKDASQNEHLTMSIIDARNNGLVWGYYDAKTASAYAWTFQNVIETQNKTVVIRSIPAGKTAFIGVVTKSAYPIRFYIPRKITAVVSGSDSDINVHLIKPVTRIFDMFPWWGFPPTAYKWLDADNDM